MYVTLRSTGYVCDVIMHYHLEIKALQLLGGFVGGIEPDPQTPRSPLSPRDLDRPRCYHVWGILCNLSNNRKVMDEVLTHDMIYWDLFFI